MRTRKSFKSSYPDQLLGIVDQHFAVTPSGTVQTHNLFAVEALDSATLFLLSQLEFGVELAETDRLKIIRRAITDTKKTGPLTFARVFAEIQRVEQSFLTLQPSRFVVATHLSVQPSGALGGRSVGKSRITFGSTLPPRFRREQETAVKKSWKLNVPALGTSGTAVRIACRAFTATSATEIALERIDYLRGIWNWHRNRTSLQIARDPLLPVNTLVLGPFHTCHDSSGKLADDILWYEDWALSLTPSPASVDWTALARAETKVRQIVLASPHRELITEAFVRYARALDPFHGDLAFLRLWSLLERLTLVGPRQGSADIVRRGTFPLGECAEKEELIQLADFRNRSVHEAAQSDHVKARLSLLRRNVERMIALWLGPCSRIQSSEQVARFLDLEPDIARLREEVALRESLIAMI